MAELSPGTRDAWHASTTAAKATAARIYDDHVHGKEPGTALPENQPMTETLGTSLTTIGNAKRLLGQHGALRKELRRWVVA